MMSDLRKELEEALKDECCMVDGCCNDCEKDGPCTVTDKRPDIEKILETFYNHLDAKKKSVETDAKESFPDDSDVVDFKPGELKMIEKLIEDVGPFQKKPVDV